MTLPPVVVAAVAGWYLLASCAAFAAFVIDKNRAQRAGARRTPERTLHLLSVVGGFPGSMLAMWGVRHKNRKAGFVMITVGLAALHGAAWVMVMVVLTRGR